ncbi:MAG: (2Fe-2S) ferredoxin domain-containing protein [Nocardioides sp.]
MRRRPRSEDGSALVEVVWLGILLLVPLLWIVLSVFEVQRGAFAVTSAARSAARAYALAETDAAGREQARAAIRQALADQGGDDRDFRFTVSCRGPCRDAGSVITVRVWHGVDLPLLPAVLGGDAPSFRLDSTHTVPIGRFRDTR